MVQGVRVACPADTDDASASEAGLAARRWNERGDAAANSPSDVTCRLEA
jgi:hypothetical protein